MGIMKASSPAHTPHLTPNLSSLPHTREQTATFQQCLGIQKLPQRRNGAKRESCRRQSLRITHWPHEQQLKPRLGISATSPAEMRSPSSDDRLVGMAR